MTNVHFIRPALASIIDHEALMSRTEPAAPAVTAPSRYNPQKGVPPSLEQKRVEDLEIDNRYQRLTDSFASQRLIGHIARNWDWRLCVPLVVSRRVEGLFVIDGQHRLSGARLRGDIPFLPCIINAYESAAEEAAMFVAANRSRRPITKVDDFRAALAAGDAVAIEIDELLRQAGLSVSMSASTRQLKPGEVVFVSSIESALKRYDRKVVSAALTNLAEAFKGQALSNGGGLFGALVQILATPPLGFDPDMLFEALGTFPAAGWSDFTDVTMGAAARVVAMRKALLMTYADKMGGSANEAVAPFLSTQGRGAS